MVNLSLNCYPTSTGIMCEVAVLGRVVLSQELSKDNLWDWVANHADLNAAISFDRAITLAVDRDEQENPKGNLLGVLESARALGAIA